MDLGLPHWEVLVKLGVAVSTTATTPR